MATNAQDITALLSDIPIFSDTPPASAADPAAGTTSGGRTAPAGDAATGDKGAGTGDKGATGATGTVDLTKTLTEFAETRAQLESLSGLRGLADALKDADISASDISFALSQVKNARQSGGFQAPAPAATHQEPAKPTPEQVQAEIESFNREFLVNPGSAIYGLLDRFSTGVQQTIQNSTRSTPMATQLAQSAVRDFKRDIKDDPDLGPAFRANESAFDTMVGQLTPDQIANSSPQVLNRTLSIFANAAIGEYTAKEQRKARMSKGSGTAGNAGGTGAGVNIGGQAAGGGAGGGAPETPINQLIRFMGGNAGLSTADIEDILVR